MIERLRTVRAAGSPALLAGALAVTVAAECVLVAVPHIGVTAAVGAAFAAASGWGLAVTDPHLEARPSWTIAAIALSFAVALAMPPRGSHDLWSYVMYGRILGVHHASPYVHPPSTYGSDPFLRMVASGWRGTRSVYGPLFTGTSALLARLDPRSRLVSRLAFQTLALLGALAVLGVVWLETKSVRALCFVGLHPVVVLAIVNGGHNDGLVGLAVLSGVVLARRRRPAAAGVAIGLGVLVKASTAFGALGIAVWLLASGRRDLARFAVLASMTTLAGYALAGPAAIGSIASSANRTSRASVWSPLSRMLHAPVGGPAIVVVAIVALVGAARFRSQPTPALCATVACAAYLVAGAYVLPWYPAWALPAAALTRRSVVGAIVAAHAAFLVVAYELPRRVRPGSLGAAARGVVLISTSAGFLALLALAIAIASVHVDFSRRRQMSTNRTRQI